MKQIILEKHRSRGGSNGGCIGSIGHLDVEDRRPGPRPGLFVSANAAEGRNDVFPVLQTSGPECRIIPDVKSPSDFFFFGIGKTKLQNFEIHSRHDLILARRAIFEEISKDTLSSIYVLWIKRLKWVIMNHGKHFNK
jgi:hypothetical protein